MSIKLNNKSNINLDINPDMEGGFLGKMYRKYKGRETFGDVVSKTKKSESKLIQSYEKAYKTDVNYQKAYSTHLKNLIQLDDYSNFNGMETIFQEVLMRKHFGSETVDKKNPLLFRNYLIESDTAPSTFRREHIKQQVTYIMNKYFGGSKYTLIKYIQVSDVTENSFKIKLTTIDNKKYAFDVSHTNYLIDKTKTKQIFNDVLTTTSINIGKKIVKPYMKPMSVKAPLALHALEQPAHKMEPKVLQPTYMNFENDDNDDDNNDKGNYDKNKYEKLPPRALSRTRVLTKKLTPLPAKKEKTKQKTQQHSPEDKLNFEINNNKDEEKQKQKIMQLQKEKQKNANNSINEKCATHTNPNECNREKDCLYNPDSNKCMKSNCETFSFTSKDKCLKNKGCFYSDSERCIKDRNIGKVQQKNYGNLNNKGKSDKAEDKNDPFKDIM